MATTKTAQAFQQLEEGLAELLESGDWQRYLKVQSQFHNYSFNNVMLILSQFPEAERVAGYQRWLELGRQVKKGSQSIKILAPLKRKVEEENDQGELEKKTGIFGFRTVSVFDISQTEGEDLPELGVEVVVTYHDSQSEPYMRLSPHTALGN
ncbi:MAG: ArdC family protein [Crocosphaera sp.]